MKTILKNHFEKWKNFIKTKKLKPKTSKKYKVTSKSLNYKKNCPASLEEAYQFTKDMYFCTNFENFIDLSCQRCHCRAWFFTHEYANEYIASIDENVDIGCPYANLLYHITNQDASDIVKVWFKNGN